jgi:hypothetical protein
MKYHDEKNIAFITKVFISSLCDAHNLNKENGNAKFIISTVRYFLE